jgi:hypothetical protein
MAKSASRAASAMDSFSESGGEDARRHVALADDQDAHLEV